MPHNPNNMALFDYQKQALQFILKRDFNAILAVAAGLGKTVITIAAIKEFCKTKPGARFHVVCPSSLKVNWKREIMKFSELEVQILDKWQDAAKITGDTQVVIYSYGLIVSKKLVLGEPDMTVFDESQNVKNMSALRTKHALKLKGAKILLSGTPILKPADLYSQLRLVGLKMPFFHYGHKKAGVEYFAEKFCAPRKVFLGNREVYTFTGASNIGELKALFQEYAFIKAAAKMEFEVTHEEVTLGEVTEAQAKTHFDFGKLNALKEQDQRKFELALSRMMLMTMRIKKRMVQNYLLDYTKSMQGEDKAIIFYSNLDMRDAITSILDKLDIAFVVIGGEVPSEKRQTIVDEFQDNDTIKFAILSQLACDTGLNIQIANVVIFTQLAWDVNQTTQCVARAARHGQRRNVNVIWLLLAGSTDDMVTRSNENRQRTIDAIMND